MANTNVFTGADGSISLAGDTTSPEGTLAETIIGGNDLGLVGRATGVRVEVSTAMRPFNEIGQRYASELRPGNVAIRGSIERAYLNGALLRLLLGEAADKRPGRSWAQPNFNMTLIAENPAHPGTRSTITLHGVRIDQWSLGMPEDDFMMESATFQALYATVGDEVA